MPSKSWKIWNFTKHLHQNPPEPHKVSALETSGTSPGTYTATLRNLTEEFVSGEQFVFGEFVFGEQFVFGGFVFWIRLRGGIRLRGAIPSSGNSSSGGEFVFGAQFVFGQFVFGIRLREFVFEEQFVFAEFVFGIRLGVCSWDGSLRGIRLRNSSSSSGENVLRHQQLQWKLLFKWDVNGKCHL